jgi:hypothetical protein
LLGPIDDVRALIAKHESTRPSATEAWLSNSGPRPSDDELRFALRHFASLAGTAIDGVARISLAAESHLDSFDSAWSLSPWVLGYQAGCAATHESYQQVTAHLANALRVKAMGE